MAVEAVPEGERKPAKGRKIVPINTPTAPAQAPASDMAAMMAMIERMMIDPAFDRERANQAFDFYQRVDAERRRAESDLAKREFVAAFVEAQREMEPIAKDANNPQTKSRYASYDALDRALRPIYTKHGFSVSFDVGEGAPVDHVRVLCFVAHKGGHEKTYHLDMPADGKGAKGGDVMTKTHAMGSALTYGKRYLHGNVWNVAPTEKDDDGNAAGAKEEDGLITSAQIDELIALADEVGADKARFCKFYGIDSLADIRQSQFEKAKAALNSKRKA